MASNNTLEEAIQYKEDLIKLLDTGKFTLHKWASNSSELLATVPEVYREKLKSFQFEEDSMVKTLGLNWHAREDNFSFEVRMGQNVIVTKRVILSALSRIFDPLGLVAPCIVVAKLLMQELWLIGLSWDSELPANLLDNWRLLSSQLPMLEDIRIPRWLGLRENSVLQLHAFSDASETAYGGCVYLRVVHEDRGEVNLVMAKSKVAPIKQISLPRLELCAAHLLVKLIAKIKNTLQLKNIDCFGWTDSMVVLAWLNDHPRKWSTFVGNRTSYILDILPTEYWRHIKSKLNPADYVSRGCTPRELMDCEIWWHGPEFLRDPNIDISNSTLYHTEVELKQQKVMTVAIDQQEDLIDRYSSLSRLLRICAWILRFKENCRQRIKGAAVRFKPDFITRDELNQALFVWVKRAQERTFRAEIKCIEKDNGLQNKSNLRSLEPFLDKMGLLRVGGRLHHANVSFEQRHPLILHKDDKVSSLIVSYYHLKYLHARGQLLESNLRLKFWIIGVKHLIRKCINNCVICRRYRAEACSQQMASLPVPRVQLAKPFSSSGVDYAGPFTIRTWKGRGAKQLKAYIAVFVCMSTKALHLELVVDLSTESFIAAFKRFIARRGAVNRIYSDNGTNFQGAVRHLKEVYEYFLCDSNRQTVHKYLSDNNIEWNFIPPSAPHFGGLWEAGVKSIKYHLRRVIANASLTYDEFYTLLCQIEYYLNSRPIVPVPSDKEDLEALTPGHFLTGQALMSTPEIPIPDNVKSYRTRWKHIQALQQHFWQRWQRDYLSTLQQRSKWIIKSHNIKVNDLVIIIDPNSSPGHWLMGRVLETHPGRDGLVRVVTLRTRNGTLKRPITKLCLLLPAEE